MSRKSYEIPRRSFLLSPVMVALILLIIPKDAVAIECLTCASTALRNHWQVTGFPKIIPDELFNDDCKSLSSFDNNWNPRPSSSLTNCPDACVTLIMVQADPTGQTGGNNMFVRGCHSELIGHTSSVKEDSCHSGNIKRIDSEGKWIPTKAELDFCIGADKCNTIADFQDSQTCGTTNKQPVTCEQCWSVGSDCKGDVGTCSGQWCTKSAGYIGNTWVVSKGCAPFNTLSKTSECDKVSDPAFFNTFMSHHPSSTNQSSPSTHIRAKRGNLYYKGMQCYCDSDHCNSAIIPTAAKLTLFTTTIPLLMLLVTMIMTD